jgi:hypothetical protein
MNLEFCHPDAASTSGEADGPAHSFTVAVGILDGLRKLLIINKLMYSSQFHGFTGSVVLWVLRD